MVAVIFLGFAALAAVAGAGGSYLIARHLPGLGALAAYLPWLAMPFVILAALLSSSVDPTLSPERASYNFAMAFVITSFVIAIPWFVANLVGGILGRRKRRAKPAPVPATQIPAPPPADPDLPNWRHGDDRPRSVDELGELMREIAARAGIDQALLPRLYPPPDREGAYLDRDKFDYIYIGLDHDKVIFDHRHVIADQTMYFVFRDVAHRLAAERLAGQGVADPDCAERLADEQQAILAGIDRRWGRQFAVDRARVAGKEAV